MRNTTTTNIIQSIDPSSVHRICSGQVILDISSCAKELIENSIDAGATNVEIRIREFGLESVEVSENGSGVARDDIQMLTMKYATSKLRTFKDLESGVETFGFRGEALSSLCGTCERLIITTRTASDEEGMKVTFDKNGDVETEEICARSVGTTVRVEKLFHPLPVRRKQFERNKAKEYAKLLRVLQGYALASETSGCRFVATHQQGKNGARQTVLQCRASVSNGGGGGFRDRVASVFGARTAESVFEIDIGLEREKSADEIEEEVKEEEEAAEDVDTDDDRFGRCTGWVSLPGLENKKTSARASADRQFFYVNGRPVDYPKIAKTLNETFRAYNATTTNANYPSCALNFEVPKHLVDVNVSPDKRTIMFTNEHDILMYFRNGIKKAFERAVGGNGERGSADGLVRNFKATGVDLSQLPMTPADALIDAPIKNTTMIETDEFEVIDDSDGEQGGEGIACALPMPPIQVKEEELMRVSADASTQQQQQQQQTDLQAFGFTREALPATQRRNAAVIDKIAAEIAAVENTETKFQSLPETYKERAVMLPSESENDDDDMKDADFDPFAMKATMAGKIASKKRKVIDNLNATTKAEENEMENDADGEKENNFEHRNAQQQRQKQQQTLKEVEFNIDVVRVKRLKRAKRAKRLALEREKKASADAELLKEASLHNQDNAAATNALIRRFDKSEFANVRVVGQFNLGFIIVVRDNTDIFIVDQHASDEIYNFERLQKTTTLNKQPLIQPQRLELSPAEEQIARSNENTFLMNGFGFCDVATSPDFPGDESSSSRLALAAVPFSKDTVFDASDVHELVAILDEGEYVVPVRSQLSVGLKNSAAAAASGSTKTVLRPSKVRNMLAMRACRSSIMIGAPLSRRRMKKILQNLSTLERPWNCPHGRPTMRHGCRL
jgi:DNA mismatch repair protein PMS2